MESQGRVSFAPDGQWLATRNKDGTISLRTAHNLKETQRLTELGTNNAGVLFAPGSQFMPDRGASSALRLTVAQADPDQIRRGIEILARVVRAREAASASSRQAAAVNM